MKQIVCVDGSVKDETNTQLGGVSAVYEFDTVGFICWFQCEVWLRGRFSTADSKLSLSYSGVRV